MFGERPFPWLMGPVLSPLQMSMKEVGDGLQDDPVVEELLLLACDVQLWQL